MTSWTSSSMARSDTPNINRLDGFLPPSLSLLQSLEPVSDLVGRLAGSALVALEDVRPSGWILDQLCIHTTTVLTYDEQGQVLLQYVLDLWLLVAPLHHQEFALLCDVGVSAQLLAQVLLEVVRLSLNPRTDVAEVRPGGLGRQSLDDGWDNHDLALTVDQAWLIDPDLLSHPLK